jgi:hypothetical protein
MHRISPWLETHDGARIDSANGVDESRVVGQVYGELEDYLLMFESRAYS